MERSGRCSAPAGGAGTSRGPYTDILGPVMMLQKTLNLLTYLSWTEQTLIPTMAGIPALWTCFQCCELQKGVR